MSGSSSVAIDMKFKINALLDAPIRSDMIKWRVSRVFIGSNPIAFVFPYVKSQACREILNRAVGVTGWQVEYTEPMSGGVCCRIGIWDGSAWIWKEDAGGMKSSMPDKGDQIKSGYSDAFKRTCRAWGIGDSLSLVGEIIVPLYSSPKKSKTEQRHKEKGKAGGQDTVWYWEQPKVPAGLELSRLDWDRLSLESESEAIKAEVAPEPDQTPKATKNPKTVKQDEPDNKPQAIRFPEPPEPEIEQDQWDDDDEEVEYSEIKEFPHITDDAHLVASIREVLEVARDTFKSWKYADRATALKLFEDRKGIRGLRIKAPADRQDGWAVYCLPKHVKEWVRHMRGGNDEHVD